MTTQQIVHALLKIAEILIAWPIIVLLLFLLFKQDIHQLVSRIERFNPKTGEIKLGSPAPTVGVTTPQPPTAPPQEKASRSIVELGGLKEKTSKTKEYPPDYFFLNHTSFLRSEKQEEFQAITRVYNVRHYDIRVIVDSYYRGALEKVAYVKYFLHEAYAQYGSAIRERNNPNDKFLLKEIANGEYVILAEVHLKEESKPIILQRYITLWDSGPRIERYLNSETPI